MCVKAQTDSFSYPSPLSFFSPLSLPFSISLYPPTPFQLYRQLTSSGLKSSATGDASSREDLNSFDVVERFLFSLTVTDLRDLSSLRPEMEYKNCQILTASQQNIDARQSIEPITLSISVTVR